MSSKIEVVSDIFVKSLVKTLKWTFWKYFFSSISTTSLTFLYYKTLYNKEIGWISALEIGVGTICAIFILRLLAIFILDLARYLYTMSKNSTYGDAIILLNVCFAAMHKYRKSKGHDDKEFVAAMVLLCNSLKEIYDKSSKSSCSVSIKVPVANNKVNAETLILNLIRDSAHRERDTKEYMETEHTLLGNTAFSYCLSQVSSNLDTKYYRNNHVNTSENYQNTSKICHKDGLLPYHSELVMPITPYGKGENICLGFICIDSDKENAFNSKYESAILEGVADGIFDIISVRNQFKMEEHEQKKQA